MELAWHTILAAAFGLLIVLTFLGIPIFVSFLIMNVAGVLVFFGPSAFGMFTSSMISILTSDSLLAVPLFLVMGEILFRGRAIDELYSALDALIGRTRLRLYVLCTSLSTILGTMSGSAMADAALLGRTLFPGMVARGYDRRLSIGMILSGASVAPIIPPSIIVVILATLANQSISEMLVAGIVPGIFLGLLFLSYAWLRVLLNPSLSPDIDDAPYRTMGQRLIMATRVIPFGFVIFMVVGVILLGIASPTEAAATGAFAAIVMSLYLRTFSLRLLGESLLGAARTTGTIFVILMSANLFGQLLAFTQAPEGMVHAVEALNASPWLVYLMLMGVAFVACMFIGQIEFMLISVPVFAPIIALMGFDPVWFWMLYLINITAGGMTPPFGITMFVFKATVPEVPLGEIYKAAMPFVGVIMFAIGVMTVFPQIVLYVPSVLR